MSAVIIRLPRAFRYPLPPDALASRDRFVDVFPYRGAWAVMECDEGGGYCQGGLTKAEAIDLAVEEWVLPHAAVLQVHNAPLPEWET